MALGLNRGIVGKRPQGAGTANVTRAFCSHWLPPGVSRPAWERPLPVDWTVWSCLVSKFKFHPDQTGLWGSHSSNHLVWRRSGGDGVSETQGRPDSRNHLCSQKLFTRGSSCSLWEGQSSLLHCHQQSWGSTAEWGKDRLWGQADVGLSLRVTLGEFLNLS